MSTGDLGAVPKFHESQRREHPLYRLGDYHPPSKVHVGLLKVLGPRRTFLDEVFRTRQWPRKSSLSITAKPSSSPNRCARVVFPLAGRPEITIIDPVTR